MIALGNDVTPNVRSAVIAEGPDQELLRLRLDIAYHGEGFSGWARQPGRRTVQQVIEETLGRILRLPSPPVLTVAGRTDAGVHARGQVAHCDVAAHSWVAAASAAQRRLARALPPDVRVIRIAPAPPGFDARFSALWRRYTYRVCDDPASADPLSRRLTLWHPRALDLAAMNEAARACLGEHDFAAFCRRRPGASTVRMLLRVDWARAFCSAAVASAAAPSGSSAIAAPSIAVATVVADAFCHNMVRSLVGAMLRVGDGHRPPRWLAQVLAAGVRDSGVPVVPAHGLCLEEIGYPPDDELAARVVATRRQRGKAREYLPLAWPDGIHRD